MTALEKLHRELARCRKCPRLVAWREEVARTKRRAYRDETYWGRPVAGFGDPKAKLLIVGLAPGAHGANRTGRIFTGDRSGDFLYAGLHRAGLASQPHAVSADDGLKLKGVFITLPVRCVPPDNKPTPRELEQCKPWFEREWKLLKPRVVLALGAIAWRAVLTQLDWPRPWPEFAHGALARAEGKPVLLGCYHVSQQNTQTGRLTEKMFDEVLTSPSPSGRRCREAADEGMAGRCLASFDRPSPRPSATLSPRRGFSRARILLLPGSFGLMRLPLLALLCCACATPAAVADTAPDENDADARGAERDELEKLLAQSAGQPDEPKLLLRLAELEAQQGRLDEKQALERKAVAADAQQRGNSAVQDAQRAEAARFDQHATQMRTAAAQHLETFTNRFPGDPSAPLAHLLLGRCHLSQSQPELALRDFAAVMNAGESKIAIEAAKDWVRAWAMTTGTPAGAKAALDSFSHAAPTQKLLERLAATYRELGRDALADETARLAQ